MNSTKYQVFISSTYNDLIDERDSVIKAILELYHIPIGMEMFSAEDEEQWEIIRRTIEVSDYYILILGLRYGSTTTDDISFTQKEYEYALEKKIPILAFLMSENTPLSKDKRDDDLSKIRQFREAVLKNTKMSQFWETKDQLAKNVSVSLMKQIMQKPAVGWIRGDKLRADEALVEELSILSKENRELRERITELESKISLKAPKLELSIVPPTIDDNFNEFGRCEMPKKLDFKDAEHLSGYLSVEDIENYNRKLPTQSELDEFNKKKEFLYKVKNYAVPLVIDVTNKGTIIANNLFVDISFPKGLFVYEANKTFPDLESPIPENPIEAVAAELAKNHFSSSLDIYNQLSGEYKSLDIINSNISSVMMPKATSIHWWTRLDDNKLTIKINDLLHTRSKKFDDEYMIVPLAQGKYQVEVTIICQEYDEPETQTIEITI